MCPAKGRSRDLGESKVFDLPSSREDKRPDLEIKEAMATYLTSLAIAATVCSIGTVESARWR